MIPLTLVESVAAFVQSVHLASTFVFFEGIISQTVCKLALENTYDYQHVAGNHLESRTINPLDHSTNGKRVLNSPQEDDMAGSSLDPLLDP